MEKSCRRDESNANEVFNASAHLSASYVEAVSPITFLSKKYIHINILGPSVNLSEPERTRKLVMGHPIDTYSVL